MNYSDRIGDFRDTLADVSHFLPVAFAVWRSGDDKAFISDKLRMTLSINQNVIDAYSFVKSMQDMFGTFLNVAVEKIELGRKEYSSTTSTPQNEEFLLNLKFYAEKAVYVLTVTNETKRDTVLKSAAYRTDNAELCKILDLLPVYVWQKNRNLQLTYCNEAYAKALDASKEYVVSNNVKLISASRRGIYVDQSLYSSKPKKTSEHVVINGSQRLLSIEETPFTKDGKSVGIAIDITDKEKLETHFRNYKKHTEEVLDNISIPIAIFDANTVLVFANQAILKMFAVGRLETCNNYKFSDIMNYMLSNNSLIVREDIIKYKTKGIELFQEVIDPQCATVHLTNGDVVSVTITPNHGGGLVFIFENITEKISLARKVNSMSSAYDETLDTLHEGTIIFGNDNKIIVTNKAAKKLWKKDKFETYVGEFLQSSAQLLTSESKTQLLSSNLGARISERIEFSETLQFLSGETIRCSYTPISAGLNILKFVDISDAVNLTKVIEEKKAITGQIDKLKSNLISNLSHEMHSSIQTITGFAEILSGKYFGELNEKQMEYCCGITNAVKILDDTVNAIVNLAKIESGQVKLEHAEVSMQSIIQNVISSLSDRLKNKGISINTNFEDAKFSVYLNEKSITQMLYYLVIRAMQEVSPGMDIEISIKVDKEQGNFEIIIRNNGELLLAEELEKIQEGLIDNSKYNYLEHSLDFYLALADNITKMHHGTLSIQSNKDVGNVVICTLPIGCFT